MSTTGPKLENVANLSFRSLAATVIASGAEPGDWFAAFTKLLPAETTTVTPAWVTAATIWFIAVDRGLPTDMLMTDMEARPLLMAWFAAV